MTDFEWTLLFSLVGFVLSVAVAYLFFWLAQRDPNPLFVVTGNVVVGRAPDDLEIIYRGTAVPRVTRTLILLWNQGRASIRSEDVREPLAIRVLGGQILEGRVIEVTRPEIRAQAFLTGPRTVEVTFSHLDRRDGFCVEVLHTDANVRAVEVGGVIIGVPRGPRLFITPLWNDPAGQWIAYGTATLLAAIGIIGAFFIDPPSPGFLVFAFPIAVWIGLWGGRTSRLSDRRYLPGALGRMSLPQIPGHGGFLWRRRAEKAERAAERSNQSP